MSRVTNTILCFSVMENEEEKLIKKVNKFFEGKKGFVLCDDESLPNGWYGGTKYLETNIAIGSFNYLSLDELCAHLKKIKWEEPENVQLIVCEQDDSKFRIIEPCMSSTQYIRGEL